MSLYCHLLSLTSEVSDTLLNIYELLASFIQTFLWVWFITKYFEFNKSKKTNIIGFIVTWLLCFFEITFINLIIVYDGMISGIIVATMVIYAQLYLKGDLYSHLFVSLYGTAIMFIVSSVAIFISAFAMGSSVEEAITDLTYARIILITSCRIAEFLAFRFIVKTKNNYRLLKRDMKFFIFIALLTWLATTFMMRAALKSAEISVYMFLLSLVLVGVNVVIYYFFIKINSDYQAKIKSEIQKQQYEQQITSQSKHIDEILVMQKQIKKFRHDSSHHFTALKGFFLNSQNHDGLSYIEKINDDLEQSEIIDTGNTAFDAIISAKKVLAESKNIDFALKIQIPEKLQVDAVDLCVIFGNALDNAIEACEKLETQKIINVSAIYDDNQLICKITNTALPSTSDLQTTKSDKENHGFGLDNIKQALSKYNHVVKIEHADNEFVLSFIIFNK